MLPLSTRHTPLARWRTGLRGPSPANGRTHCCWDTDVSWWQHHPPCWPHAPGRRAQGQRALPAVLQTLQHLTLPHPSTDIRKQRHIFQTSIFDSICSSERIHRKQAGLGMVTSRRAQDAKIIQQGKPIRIVTNQPKAFKQALAHENPLAQQGTGEIGG